MESNDAQSWHLPSIILRGNPRPPGECRSVELSRERSASSSLWRTGESMKTGDVWCSNSVVTYNLWIILITFIQFHASFFKTQLKTLTLTSLHVTVATTQGETAQALWGDEWWQPRKGWLNNLPLEKKTFESHLGFNSWGIPSGLVFALPIWIPWEHLFPQAPLISKNGPRLRTEEPLDSCVVLFTGDTLEKRQKSADFSDFRISM